MDEFVLEALWILEGGTVGGADTKGGRCQFQYEPEGGIYNGHGAGVRLVVAEK